MYSGESFPPGRSISAVILPEFHPRTIPQLHPTMSGEMMRQAANGFPWAPMGNFYCGVGIPSAIKAMDALYHLGAKNILLLCKSPQPY